MRDRMERLVVLPFSVGCVSHSSVAVSVQQPSTTSNSSAIGIQEEEDDDRESLLSSVNMKNSFRFLALPKPNISTGFQRLFKTTFKSFSQLFVYKEEEVEMEMEIGFPTDVKHVTHIGLDDSASASAATNPIKGWDNLIPPQFLSLPSVSLRQFQLNCNGN